MSYRSNNNDGLAILGAIFIVIFTIIITIFIAPFISFWLCYFGGWIAKVTIGTELVKALNTLFNTTYFTKDMIPMIAGALGWIGSFFKTMHITKKNK